MPGMETYGNRDYSQDRPSRPKPSYELTIVVPDIFEGTLAQWQDTFYTLPAPIDNPLRDVDLFACLGSIMRHCEDMDWDCEIRWIQSRSRS